MCCFYDDVISRIDRIFLPEAETLCPINDYVYDKENIAELYEPRVAIYNLTVWQKVMKLTTGSCSVHNTGPDANIYPAK